MGESDVEQVVSGHTQLQAAHALRGEQPTQHALVVGVRGLFGGHGGNGPAVHLGVHAFQCQVGALDQADLDLRAAVSYALGGPLGEPLHGTQGVREVSLYHDAGFQVLQLRLVEQTPEDLHGQFQVRVDLHVQVDEHVAGLLGRGGLVQRQQPLDHTIRGAVEAPVGQLRHHGGDLEGDVVHIRAVQQVLGVLQVLLGFLFAEHLLAQEVDVEAVTLFLHGLHGLAEGARAGIHHHVSHHLAQAGTRGRNHDG